MIFPTEKKAETDILHKKDIAITRYPAGSNSESNLEQALNWKTGSPNLNPFIRSYPVDLDKMLLLSSLST